ncbi:hypothetical protein, partial [Parapedobacter tibetensis]|uniref:hypothetical protein n=1 Tax=Parapedobacter tibetensis TaxID=2972951 RepID=UPI00214D6116
VWVDDPYDPYDPYDPGYPDPDPWPNPGQQRDGGDKPPASTPWRDLLTNDDSYKDHLELVNNWYLEDENGNYILDANGQRIPNIEVSNCHYYAFGPNSDPNSYESPWTKFIAPPDRSNYTELPYGSGIQVGDRVSYFIWVDESSYALRHSGIVTEVDSEGYATKVSSRFGVYEPVEHHPRDVPPSYGPTEPSVVINGATRPSRIYYRPNN